VFIFFLPLGSVAWGSLCLLLHSFSRCFLSFRRSIFYEKIAIGVKKKTRERSKKTQRPTFIALFGYELETKKEAIKGVAWGRVFPMCVFLSFFYLTLVPTFHGHQIGFDSWP